MSVLEGYSMGKIFKAAAYSLVSLMAAYPRFFSIVVYPVEKLGPRKYKPWAGIFREAAIRNHPLLWLARRFVKEVNPHCRQALLESLLDFRWSGSDFPRALVISVTNECNYSCSSCFNSAHMQRRTMSGEELNRIVAEAKACGTRVFAVSGGEPLLMPGLLDVVEKHRDVYFQLFTNGSLLTPEVAERLARMGNVMVLISLDGDEAETDKRRGKGAYRGAIKAMHNLRRSGAVFGCNVMVARENMVKVTSESFVTSLIESGALIIWYIAYRPVGEDPDFSLILTREEHFLLHERIRKIRDRYPILALENLYDCFPQGCLATQGLATHIDPEGNLTPCPPMHFSTDNVLTNGGVKRAIETSPLLRAVRDLGDRGGGCVILERPMDLLEHINKLRAEDITGGRALVALNKYIRCMKASGRLQLQRSRQLSFEGKTDLYGEIKALLFEGHGSPGPKALDTRGRTGDKHLLRLVVDFLRRHSYCTLATSDGRSPHASVVLYASKGLELYFFTGSDTKKIRNITKNPRVAVAVEGRKFLVFPQAVEMQGRAEVLPRDDPEAGRVYFSRLRMEHKIAKRIYDKYDVRWVKIVPDRIFTYRIGTRFWRIDPAEQFRRIALE